mgnify:CR=1 FL=1
MNECSGDNWRIVVGDVRDGLRSMPDGSAHCCVTSPPYWGLRDYGVDGQIGSEPTPEVFVATMVDVFREVRRVLRDDGTVWLNLGDSYTSGGRKTRDPGKSKIHPSYEGDAYKDGMRPDTPPGLKPKDLCGIPWRVALALQEDGWYLRSDIIWHKPNPMPSSVTDRPTTSHEYVFLLAKSERYFYDAEAIRERSSPNTNLRASKSEIARISEARAAGANTSVGKVPSPKAVEYDGLTKQNRGFETAVCLPVESRNARTVWKIATQPFRDAHFATFPEALPRRCILAGTSERGVCPSCGAPWLRVINSERVRTRPGTDSKAYEPSKDKKQDALGKRTYTGFNERWKQSQEIGNRDPGRHVSIKRTIGWEPTCKCDAGDPIPATVLEPFAGSGTTLAVARQLGRAAIGCELNPEYAAIAEKRINQAIRPTTYRDESKEDDAPLFRQGA